MEMTPEVFLDTVTYFLETSFPGYLGEDTEKYASALMWYVAKLAESPEEALELASLDTIDYLEG